MANWSRGKDENNKRAWRGGSTSVNFSVTDHHDSRIHEVEDHNQYWKDPADLDSDDGDDSQDEHNRETDLQRWPFLPLELVTSPMVYFQGAEIMLLYRMLAQGPDTGRLRTAVPTADF